MGDATREWRTGAAPLGALFVGDSAMASALALALAPALAPAPHTNTAPWAVAPITIIQGLQDYPGIAGRRVCAHAARRSGGQLDAVAQRDGGCAGRLTLQGRRARAWRYA